MQLSGGRIWLFLYPNKATALASPHDVAMFSSIVQRSVTYLDLSVCEYSKRLRTTSSERNVWKLVVPETTAIVGALNLDSPHHFDKRLKVLGDMAPLRPDDRERFVDSICALPSIYFRGFEMDIVRRINRSQDKMQELRKYMKAITTMRLCEANYRIKLYECFLDVLIQERSEDSGLLMEFLELGGHNLITWLLHVQNERRLDYVLCHTQRLGCDTFQCLSNYLCPLNISILAGLLPNIQVLLKYGYISEIPIQSQNTPLEVYLPPCPVDQLEWGQIRIPESTPKFRVTLLIQLLHLYFRSIGNHAAAAASTRMLWRALPEAFLDEREVTDAFRYTSFDNIAAHQAYLGNVWAYYASVLAEEGNFRSRQPRTLAHQCRCRVRKVLSEKRQLPGGIENLGLPSQLKSYLNLEY